MVAVKGHIGPDRVFNLRDVKGTRMMAAVVVEDSVADAQREVVWDIRV